jgi:hypothetical protein
MRRTKTPLLAIVFLGLSGGWIASCSDDSSTVCAPQETRICAGAGRRQGVETCLPDGSGYGACDLSGKPREGTGGTSGEPEPVAYIGLACAANTDCGPGLTCFTSNSNDFLGGGPGNGYCTLACTEDAQCTSIDRQSNCVVPQAGASGLCLRTCLSLSPTTIDESKCLGRVDVACQSEAYLGRADFSGSRQAGWCYPQCGSDEDCPGRRCDLARGICVDTPTAGLPIGAHCDAASECAGRTCLRLTETESFCSAPCVFGQPIGCGYGLTGGPRDSGCIGARVRGFLSTEGLGDVGFCGELCTENADCSQSADRGWICDPTQDAISRFGRAGVCDRPTPLDGGVDAGESNDASQPPSVGDAG